MGLLLSLIPQFAVAQPDNFTTKVHYLADKYEVNPELALRIMNCESKLNPLAINHNTNGTTDYSYWQLNSIWRKQMSDNDLDIKDPDQNLEAGFIILSEYGTNQWRDSKTCWKS